MADELVGSREIVVKSVGPWRSPGIRGISGATILGDGRIVIILDINALVRGEWRARAQAAAAPRERGDRRTFAMVVDDSITVRRVTQRLLERNGMRVLTARDGMDAVALLQDNVPDVILLDIEMPRMDGYEVAAHVRSDPRLKDVLTDHGDLARRVRSTARGPSSSAWMTYLSASPTRMAQLLDAIALLVERRHVAGRVRHRAGISRRKRMLAERVAEIYSLRWSPLGRRPAASFRAPAWPRWWASRPPPPEMTGAPCRGTSAPCPGNGKAVPLISFEGACGQMIPPASGRSRIVVLQVATVHAGREAATSRWKARGSRSWRG